MSCVSSINDGRTEKQGVPKTISAASPPHLTPGTAANRAVSVIGWSIAVLTGVLLWALGFLLVG